MNVQVQPHVHDQRHLPFECVALVLQDGGALGAYHYEVLAEAGIHPDWIAGISIGAINAAIIAGNPPNSRVDRLREFWTQVTVDGLWPLLGDANLGLARGDAARNFLSQMSATMAPANGASGFFAAAADHGCDHRRISSVATQGASEQPASLLSTSIPGNRVVQRAKFALRGPLRVICVRPKSFRPSWHVRFAPECVL
jgi:predicted acylesterase/phospholipase RssA